MDKAEAMKKAMLNEDDSKNDAPSNLRKMLRCRNKFLLKKKPAKKVR